MKTRRQAEKLAEQGVPNTPPQALDDTTRPRRTNRSTSRQPSHQPKSRSTSIEPAQPGALNPPKTRVLAKQNKGREGVTKKSKDTKGKAASTQKKGRSRQITPASDAEDEAPAPTRRDRAILDQLAEEDESPQTPRQRFPGPPSRDEIAHNGPPRGNDVISISSTSPLSSPPSSPEEPAPAPRRTSETVKTFREILGQASPRVASMPAETLVDNQNMVDANQASPVSTQASPTQRNYTAVSVGSQTPPSPPPQIRLRPTNNVAVQTDFSGELDALFVLREAGRGPGRDGTIVPYSTVSLALPTEMVPTICEGIANHRLLRGTQLPLLIDRELNIQLLGYQTYSEMPDENGMVNLNGEMKLPIYNKELDTDSEHEDAQPVEAQAPAQLEPTTLPASTPDTPAPQVQAPTTQTPAQQVQTPEPRGGIFSTITRTVSKFVPTFGRSAAPIAEPEDNDPSDNEDAPQQAQLPAPRVIRRRARPQTAPQTAPQSRPVRPTQRTEKVYTQRPGRVSPMEPGTKLIRSEFPRENQYMDQALMPRLAKDKQRKDRIEHKVVQVPSNPTEQIRREKWEPVLQKVGDYRSHGVKKAAIDAYTNKLKEQRQKAKKSKRQEELERVQDAEYAAKEAVQMRKAAEEKMLELEKDLNKPRRTIEEIMKAYGGTPTNPYNLRQGFQKKMQRELEAEYKQLMEEDADKVDRWENYCRLASRYKPDGSFASRYDDDAKVFGVNPRLTEIAKKLGKDWEAEAQTIKEEKHAALLIQIEKDKAEMLENERRREAEQEAEWARKRQEWLAKHPPQQSQSDQQAQASNEAESSKQGEMKKGKKRKKGPSPVRSAMLAPGTYGLTLDMITYSSSESSSDEDENDKDLSPPPSKRRDTGSTHSGSPKASSSASRKNNTGSRRSQSPPKRTIHNAGLKLGRKKKWLDMQDALAEVEEIKELQRHRGTPEYEEMFEKYEENCIRRRHHPYVEEEEPEAKQFQATVEDADDEGESTPATPVQQLRPPDAGARTFTVPSPSESDSDSESDRSSNKGKSPAPVEEAPTASETMPPPPRPPTSLESQREALNKYKPKEPSHLRHSSRISGSTFVSDDAASTHPLVPAVAPAPLAPLSPFSSPTPLQREQVQTVGGDETAATKGKSTTKPSPLGDPAASSSFSAGVPSFGTQISAATTAATTFSAAAPADSQSSIGPGPFSSFDDYVKDKPLVGFLVNTFAEKDPGAFAAGATKPFAEAFASLASAAVPRSTAALDVEAWVNEHFTAERRAEAMVRLAPIWENAAPAAS